MSPSERVPHRGAAADGGFTGRRWDLRAVSPIGSDALPSDQCLPPIAFLEDDPPPDAARRNRDRGGAAWAHGLASGGDEAAWAHGLASGGDEAAWAHGLASGGDGVVWPHRLVSGGAAVLRPRPGWYAYRVVASTALPSWATEMALTIERPVPPETQTTGFPADAVNRAAPPHPVRVGSRPDADEEAAPWEPGSAAGPVQAVVLLRAPPRSRLLWSLAEAAMEVEALAGLRSADGPRVLVGPALPGLMPLQPVLAEAQLGLARARGLPVPLRRRQPAVERAPASWRAGAGSVLTCDGPGGRSAQAVIALRGAGDLGAITPPAGGALVLRAWRSRRTWGLACALVLGAAEARGLGREAGGAAGEARAAGWHAAVLSGPAALQLARAGDPACPAPEAAAHAASATQVGAMVEACLAASGLDLAAATWTLAVSP